MSQVAVARQLFGVQGTTLREKGGRARHRSQCKSTSERGWLWLKNK